MTIEERPRMRALTVHPGQPNSIRLEDVPAPPQSDGTVLVRALALGICGTDREIIAGHYGWAPPGQQRLIIGHESLGRVEEAPAGCGISPGDLVVGIVRRPDPVPCPGLRRRRMGHVPQRPLHRARHQAAQRLWLASNSASSRIS